MKRVLVLGCPGSGKTYFSKRLAQKTNLPLVHIDNIYWNKDKVSCSREELINRLKPILAQEEWILDGNYHQTLELRLERCTDVFFLNLPREVCVRGMKERIGVVRDDIPWVESEEDAEELIEWTKDYEEKTRPIELELLKKYPKINVVEFSSQSEMDEYLKNL